MAARVRSRAALAAAVALAFVSVGATAASHPSTAAQPAALTHTTVVAAGADPSDRADDLAERRMLAVQRASRATRPQHPTVVRTTPTRAAKPAAHPTQRHAPRRTTHRVTVPRRATAPTRPVALPAAGRARAVVAYALAQLGKPYRWATAGPYSFDCSGLVLAAYARVGISLPHQTGGIIGFGRSVSRGALQPGDIVFPTSGHVGIYIGGGRMVHAPHPGARVEIASLYSFWAARRLL